MQVGLFLIEISLTFSRLFSKSDFHTSSATIEKIRLWSFVLDISDHLSPVIKSQFKESDTGREYKCPCIKTAAIVNCVGDVLLQSDML